MPPRFRVNRSECGEGGDGMPGRRDQTMKSILMAIASAVGGFFGFVIGCLFGVGLLMVWVSIGHYFECTTEISLLGYIGVMTTALLSHFTFKAVKPPMTPDERDYCVVTDDSYRWDITLKGYRGTSIKAEVGGTTIAFDNFDAAKIYYRRTERAHDPLKLHGRDLNYHTALGYDEQETRLWVVTAHSKAAAHDKVWYEESRRLLAYDGSRDHLLLVTNNEPRQRTYISWWSEQRSGARETA
jgi:hypothetical protein